METSSPTNIVRNKHNMSQKLLNKTKIAFIICTNDEMELEECVFYLNHLNVPPNYDVDLIAVKEASSMASGYNQAMLGSDAKYKIYLHQDVFILNQDFLIDILSIFKADENIGLLGCIGCQKLPNNANAVTAWNVGRLQHNCLPNEKIEYQDEAEIPTEVDAVDGCLIATQYDIPWREDLFDGWDFYDISHCYEFHRLGKKIMVPYQKNNWIYHDNQYSKMTNYDNYRKRFIEEYQEYHFELGAEKQIAMEYYGLQEKVLQLVENLFYRGEMESLCAVFINPANRGILALKEYELLAQIYQKEALLNDKKLFSEINTDNIIEKIRELKFLIKRIEYNVGCQEENIKVLLQSFSEAAIKEMILAYCIEKNNTWDKIRNSSL